jgi:RAB protein geranylgeranyltransferase component A
MEFVAIKQIFLHHIDKFLSTPCSKSEIFMSSEIPLLEKQKLLNFIYAIMKIKNKTVDVNTTVEFKKDNEVDVSVYEDVLKNLNKTADEFLSLRFSSLLQKIIKNIMGNFDTNCEENYSLDYLCENVYKYLNSLSVYGNTPFIIPLYGSSEFSQAMSRMSSVYGTVYIVNDCLEVECGVNNEYYVDSSNSYFIVKIFDKSNNCYKFF